MLIVLSLVTQFLQKLAQKANCRNTCCSVIISCGRAVASDTILKRKLINQAVSMSRHLRTDNDDECCPLMTYLHGGAHRKCVMGYCR